MIATTFGTILYHIPWMAFPDYHVSLNEYNFPGPLLQDLIDSKNLQPIA